MAYCLLTGATGLIGSYLMRDLLDAGLRLAILARPSKRESARQRIETIMGRWDEESRRALPRPVVLEGTVTGEQLGLDEADLRWLSNNCNAVVHSAASATSGWEREDANPVAHSSAPSASEVNERDAEPWRTNLFGVQNLLTFARHTGISQFHHISTAYICGQRRGRILESELDVGQYQTNAYTASKCEAEKLVRQADFFNSVTVYRPSVVIGDSVTGYTSSFHALYLPLRLVHTIFRGFSFGQLEERRLQELVQTLQDELNVSGHECKNVVPVDWVSQVITHIVAHPEHHGRTYHLAPETPVTAQVVRRAMVESTLKYGGLSAEPTIRSFPKWNDFIPFFREQMKIYEHYWTDEPNFDTTNTRDAAPHLACPLVDHELLNRVFKFALESGFGWPRPVAIPPRFDVREHLRSLPQNGEDGRGHRLGLQVNGGGGGQWELSIDGGRTLAVTPGISSRCTSILHLNANTFAELVNGNSTVEQLLKRGELLIEGNHLAISTISNILKQIQNGPPSESARPSEHPKTDNLLNNLRQRNMPPSPPANESGPSLNAASQVKHFDATSRRKGKMRQQAERVASNEAPPANDRTAPDLEFSSSQPSRVEYGKQPEPRTASAIEQPKVVASLTTTPTRRKAARVPAEQIESFLIEFIIEQTGYPPEIVELDADLEADLGIDSIKKAQMFGELREHFDFKPAADLTLDDFPTLRHVVGFLQEVSSRADAEKGSARTGAETASGDLDHGLKPYAAQNANQTLDSANLLTGTSSESSSPLPAVSATKRSSTIVPARAAELHERHINPVLLAISGAGRWVKTFIRGEGNYLWDTEGGRYLDFVAGCGSLNLGHNHPRIVASLKEALAGQAPGFAQSAINPYAAALAERLAAVAPSGLEMVFFANSGTESVEAALKLSRMATGRSTLLYCDGSYHGKTLGALSVTSHEPFREPFRPLVPECESVPYGDIDALRRAMSSKRCAAFIVEPVQGERGTIVPPSGYLREAQRLCRETQTLFVVDEVQTGLGRTGKLLACNHDDLDPDVLTLAKSLGGGLMPIGAMLTRRELWKQAYGSVRTFALHTSTFGGGSLACAAALATLDVLEEEPLVENAQARGSQLYVGLSKLAAEYPSAIKTVRGKGLMVGLELQPPHGTIVSLASVFNGAGGGRLKELGVDSERLIIALPASFMMQRLLEAHSIYTLVAQSNPLVLRVQPPLTITNDEVASFISAVESICEEMADPLAIVRPLLTLQDLHHPTTVSKVATPQSQSTDTVGQPIRPSTKLPTLTGPSFDPASSCASVATAGHRNVQSQEELEAFLVNFVVEQTGYPSDLIELDADLEADLGIDSIKKAQMFGELRDCLDITPTEELTLDDFPTLRHVLNFIKESQQLAPRVPRPAAAARLKASSVVDGKHSALGLRAPERSANKASVLATLRRLMLENNIADVGQVQITPDTKFIDDLGLDSLSLPNLVTAVENEYGISFDVDDLTHDVLNSVKLFASLIQQKCGAGAMSAEGVRID